ncbi:hypothetical protein [Profundibacterium mesophilum]|uniref:Prokaryotic membrane lipoprotein lipid attachment site domain containing protein n=1 Tax=Profundibacterium mesophilum KAUST100406-0324 TaxID=1037889 RepID=A0A921NYE5_9RHOB|nr:hypothetical protein [Profundibacterium mesophilum]KAF0676989.1 Prokaryotic membrane lipoprotein lipid attachment site domain containing protein [Profundibacterium mesophilum KAUST100406-0324]
MTRMTGATIAFLTACLGASGAGAEPAAARIYLYDTAPNYCPAGLSPVTIDGTISCGVPNSEGSYVEASPSAHETPRRSAILMPVKSARHSQGRSGMAPVPQAPTRHASGRADSGATVMGRPSIERDLSDDAEGAVSLR